MPSATTPEDRVLMAMEGAPTADEASPGERARARHLADVLGRLGARVVLSGDPDYPPGLRDLADPPRALVLRGTLPPVMRAVAIVGSRAATPYGLARASELARDLARLGFAVVSGLARGIDAAAHRGALLGEGASVAVLPGGLDAITPRGHEALAESLCARGALVSERLSGPPGFRGAFVKRNRLIAALAGATVVVEAAERSGALSTAAAARRLGRALLAVPGDVDRPTSRGTNALLGSGARLCASAADAVDALGGADHDEAGDAGAERRLMAALDGTARTAEDLARAAGLTTGDALARLLALEWAGVARRGPGPRWSGRKG